MGLKTQSFLQYELKGNVYLDSMIYIYHFEKNPYYFKLTHSLFTKIQERKILCMASALLLTEVLTKPKKENNLYLAHFYKTFIKNNIEIIDFDSELAEKAASIRAQYNLKTPDAIHLATALEGDADFFITNDLKMKNIENLMIMNLKDFQPEVDQPLAGKINN